MKKRKNSWGLFSGLALGLASIYALKLYSGMSWTAVQGFMMNTALLVVAMLILAALLVGIIKLAGKLLARFRGTSDQDTDNDHE